MTKSTDNNKGEWMGPTVKRQKFDRIKKKEREILKVEEEKRQLMSSFGKNWGPANGITKGRSRR